METSAQPWRELWPRFGRVFAIELALSLAVMVTAWAALGAAAAPTIYKARFTELWMSLLSGKLEVMERVALDSSASVAGIDEKREITPRVAQRIEGTSLVLSGVFPGQPAYEIRFAPEVAPGSAIALWRCTGTTLTGRWMPSQCRPASSS